MSYIGPITNNFIKACINEFQKTENKIKINKYIVNPLIKEIVSKNYSYIVGFVMMQSIVIILLLYIIFLVRNISQS